MELRIVAKYVQQGAHLINLADAGNQVVQGAEVHLKEEQEEKSQKDSQVVD